MRRTCGARRHEREQRDEGGAPSGSAAGRRPVEVLAEQFETARETPSRRRRRDAGPRRDLVPVEAFVVAEVDGRAVRLGERCDGRADDALRFHRRGDVRRSGRFDAGGVTDRRDLATLAPAALAATPRREAAHDGREPRAQRATVVGRAPDRCDPGVLDEVVRGRCVSDEVCRERPRPRRVLEQRGGVDRRGDAFVGHRHLLPADNARVGGNLRGAAGDVPGIRGSGDSGLRVSRDPGLGDSGLAEIAHADRAPKRGAAHRSGRLSGSGIPGNPNPRIPGTSPVVRLPEVAAAAGARDTRRR